MKKKHDEPCPNCGHCPTCGRANTYPYLGTWVSPWQWPYYPGITWSTTPYNGTISISGNLMGNATASLDSGTVTE